MRGHAAFYIAEGHRLLSPSKVAGTLAVPRAFAQESSLSLSGITMGSFNVDDYFDINLGGKDEIEDLADDGATPIVSTSEFSNGVTAWRRARLIYPSPAITVATDGSTCSSFVQEFPFYAFYKVAILRPKQANFPVDAMYYIAYLLKRERWRYVYARKFGKARLRTTSLYGPMKNGEPDFQKMARLVREAAAFPIIKSFRDAHRDAEADDPSNNPEDYRDAEIARKRLADILKRPKLLIEGDDLEKRLADTYLVLSSA